METKLELKRKAFEYILYKMVIWYIEVNKVKSTVDIDRYDFTIDKMRLLPFFVCIASTDRKTMFSLFDCFFASSKHGILEKDIVDYPFGPNHYPFRFLKCGKFNYNWDKVENFLEDNAFDFGPRKVSLSRKDFCTEGVPYELIDKSIEHLKKCNKEFVNHEYELLRFYSKRQTCYQVYHVMHTRFRQDAKISIEFLLKEKSCYAAEIENMAFC